jgi:hypothetical protein
MKRPSPSSRRWGAKAMGSMKRGSVAIVGAAESDIGSVAADMSVIDLMA